MLSTVGQLLRTLLEPAAAVARAVAKEPAADLQAGEINVVVAPAPGQVLATCLAVYAPLGRLPRAAELLFCTALTSLEEVLILLRRCFDAARAGQVRAAELRRTNCVRAHRSLIRWAHS